MGRLLRLGVASATGTAAALSPLVQTLLVLGFVALIVLLAAVIFWPSDRPKNNLVDIIHAAKGFRSSADAHPAITRPQRHRPARGSPPRAAR
jgi:hypothetical protein